MVTRSLHAEPSWLRLSVSTFAKFFLWQVHTMSLFYDKIAEKLDTYRYAKQTFLMCHLWRSVVGSRIVSAFVSTWEGCHSHCGRVATPRLTNAWAGPLPSSGVPRPDIPKPAPHLHQRQTSVGNWLPQVRTTWDPLSIAINNNGNTNWF